MGDIRRMFDPRTVAFFGDPDADGTDGKTLLANLLSSGRQKVFWVGPGKGPHGPFGQTAKLRKAGVPLRREGPCLTCCRDIAGIGEKVDLAVVASPAPTIPLIVESCGKAGVDGMVIVSGGFTEGSGEKGRIEEEIRQIGKRYGVRILGPNRASIVRPGKGLNASVFATQPSEGNIAFITQSPSFGSAVLDWAAAAHVGFSTVVSLGSTIDVDFGDLIDLLGEDPQTRSIMIYMESIGNARKFMSAARGFARNKPILVVKPGQLMGDMEAFLSHRGATPGYDGAYDVAFRRAGVVRVRGMSDLFGAAEVLLSRHLPEGPRLAILANVGGVGASATDILVELGGTLAQLGRQSVEALRPFLARHSGRDNPVDLSDDATIDTFIRAVRICLADAQTDGLLVVYAQSRAAPPTELAEAVAAVAKEAYKPLLVTWMGTEQVREGREILKRSMIPTYRTPEEAVKTYFCMYQYKRNLELLYETPAELPVDQSPPKNSLKALIKRTLREERRVLTEAESKNFLASYGIPSTTPFMAGSIDSAAELAEKPDHVDYRLVLGAKKDGDFGPVIFFGRGGTGADLSSDIAFGIPPLNQTLARLLMEGTKIYKTLGGSVSRKGADLGELEQIIVSFSNLIVDFPEIAEIYVNPLVIADGKARAVNARVVLEPPGPAAEIDHPHVVITPYPTRYVSRWLLSDGLEVLLRPIRPEDEPLEHELLTSVSQETMRARFFAVIRDISHEMLVRYCNIDYEREMAIVAELKESGRKKLIGIARLICNRESTSGEFAVLVHDAFQRKGLGYKLVDVIIGIAEEKGLERIFGEILSDNQKMLAVCAKLGFTTEGADHETTRVSFALR